MLEFKTASSFANTTTVTVDAFCAIPSSCVRMCMCVCWLWGLRVPCVYVTFFFTSFYFNVYMNRHLSLWFLSIAIVVSMYTNYVFLFVSSRTIWAVLWLLCDGSDAWSGIKFSAHFFLPLLLLFVDIAYIWYIFYICIYRLFLWMENHTNGIKEGKKLQAHTRLMCEFWMKNAAYVSLN